MAFSQSLPLLERCCMGAVSQIKDLDSTSSPSPTIIPNFSLNHLSSLKYGRPSASGGWFSRFLRREMIISTTMVTTYGSILNSS